MAGQAAAGWPVLLPSAHCCQQPGSSCLSGKLTPQHACPCRVLSIWTDMLPVRLPLLLVLLAPTSCLAPAVLFVSTVSAGASTPWPLLDASCCDVLCKATPSCALPVCCQHKACTHIRPGYILVSHAAQWATPDTLCALAHSFSLLLLTLFIPADCYPGLHRGVAVQQEWRRLRGPLRPPVSLNTSACYA